METPLPVPLSLSLSLSLCLDELLIFFPCNYGFYPFLLFSAADTQTDRLSDKEREKERSPTAGQSIEVNLSTCLQNDNGIRPQRPPKTLVSAFLSLTHASVNQDINIVENGSDVQEPLHLGI
jgi:hypothetical protein